MKIIEKSMKIIEKWGGGHSLPLSQKNVVVPEGYRMASPEPEPARGAKATAYERTYSILYRILYRILYSTLYSVQ